MILLKTILENYDIIGHLRSRGVDPDKTTVLLDKENGIATFLLYNLSGKLVGYQRYNPRGDKKDHTNSLMAKYYNYVTKEDGAHSAIAVWGLDTLDMSEPYLFITEGIFDIVKLKNLGLPGIAVLSNNPKHLLPWFKILNKKIIAVLDSDDSGSKLRNVADYAITTPSPYKDLGDMPDEEVIKFISPVINKFKEGTIKNPKINWNTTINNPETGNDILLKTALGYLPDHPAHILAKKIITKSKKSE